METNYRTTSDSSTKKPVAAFERPWLNLSLPAPLIGHLPALDELKGLAILMVILYHAGGVLVWQNTLHGDLGVDVFVVLSGVGLTLSSRTEGAASFLKRRFWRIYPAYWLVLIVYTAMDVYFLQKHYSAANLIVHVLGLQGWFGDVYGFAINDSFWFVTLIVSLYGIYCVLKSVIVSADRLLLVAAVVCLGPTLALYYTGQSGIFAHVGLRLPGFFVGLLLGRLLRTGSLSLPLTAAFGLALLLFTYVPYTQGIVFTNVPITLCVMGGYLWLIRPQLPESARGGLRFLGDRSLEIFLIHQPLIRDYNYYVHGRWFGEGSPSAFSMIVGMAVGLAVTLLLSHELHGLLKRILPR